jgi:hypothetical protein
MGMDPIRLPGISLSILIFMAAITPMAGRLSTGYITRGWYGRRRDITGARSYGGVALPLSAAVLEKAETRWLHEKDPYDRP